MTSEAAESGSIANVASEGLTTFVERRARELKGEKPAAVTPEAKAQVEPTSQAEEVKAKEPEASKAPKPEGEKPEGDGKAAAPKVPDFDWASDKLKRRLTDLHAKGHVNEDDIADIKENYLLKRGAYKKMEEAAERRKAADAEVAGYREDAEAMRSLLRDEKRKAAYLKALEDETPAAVADVPPEYDPLDPKQQADLAYKQGRKAASDEWDAREAVKAKAVAEHQARVKALEGWADEHREMLADSTTDDSYNAALKDFLTKSRDDDPELLSTLTEKALRTGVNATLERMRLESELKQLREQASKSKREAARAASASSSPGIRASVEQAFDRKTLNGRVAATLSEVGGREGWNRLRR